MIKFHPSEQHLVHYVLGELSPAMLMMVGSHVDMCPTCQMHLRDIEEQLSLKAFGQRQMPVAPLDEEAMLNAIFNSKSKPALVPIEVRDYLSLEGKRFKLPATLARNGERIGPWSKMLGKMWRAPIDIGSGETLNFIYMDQGAQVPEHTHRGFEATLVVNGVFSDEADEYRDGDFVLLDGQHKHAPQTQHDDCLTLATIDAPMQFTSGLSRLLNPFSSLFLK
jgi:putative transcriptional regulator